MTIGWHGQVEDKKKQREAVDERRKSEVAALARREEVERFLATARELNCEAGFLERLRGGKGSLDAAKDYLTEVARSTVKC